MLGLCSDAQLPQLDVQILHIRADTLTDRTEVMIFQFLSLRSGCAEQGTTGVDQVFSL